MANAKMDESMRDVKRRLEQRNQFRVDLGQRIVRMRIWRGIDSSTLCRMLGWNHDDLFRIEHGFADVTLLEGAQLAAALGCSLNELIGDLV